MNKQKLSMTLGNNTLVFSETWQMSSSELLIAAKQINELLDEKMMQNQYIEELKKEIIETNKIKTVALDMVRLTNILTFSLFSNSFYSLLTL